MTSPNKPAPDQKSGAALPTQKVPYRPEDKMVRTERGNAFNSDYRVKG